MPFRLAMPIVRILALSVLFATTAGATQLTTIAASGEPAPGTGPGVTFASVGYPAIDSSGDVAFYGTLQGSGVVASTNANGVWLSTSNGLRLVARAGDSAPGTPTGDYFTGAGEPIFNDANTLLFSGALAGPGVTDQNRVGYWVEDGNGPLQLLYRQGDPVAGAGSGVTLSGVPDLGGIAWSNAGTALTGLLSGPTVTASNTNAVVATVPAGGLSVVARQGDQAPGMPSGALFTGSGGPPQIADNGEIVVRMGAINPVVPSSNGGLWRKDPGGSLSPVVLLGDHAPLPGADKRVFFSSITSPGFAADGAIFFVGGTDAPYGVGYDIEPSLWRVARDGTISLLVAGDSQAPGFSAGTQLRQIQPVASGPDTYVFRSTLNQGNGIGPNNDVTYWLLRGGKLTLLAQEGGTVSNLPGMPTFGFREYDPPFPWTNSKGDLAFLAYLSGPGFTVAPTDAIVFASSDLGVVSVIQAGEQLAVAPGDNRVVQLLDNGFTPVQSFLNDSRELVIPVSFEDESTAIVEATVPEPSTSWLLTPSFAVLAILFLRRKGRS